MTDAARKVLAVIRTGIIERIVDHAVEAERQPVKI
jgi:hypothetical protein